MIMSGFPEECLSSQWFDVEQSQFQIRYCMKNNIFD